MPKSVGASSRQSRWRSQASLWLAPGERLARRFTALRPWRGWWALWPLASPWRPRRLASEKRGFGHWARQRTARRNEFQADVKAREACPAQRYRREIIQGLTTVAEAMDFRNPGRQRKWRVR